jgi:Flp pilus assembly protein TadG
MRSRGFAALELALLTLVAVLLILLAVYGGRVYLAQSMVDEAAHAGARAASQSASAPAATRDATDVAMATLAQHGSTCSQPTVTVDTRAFHPKGNVIVYVTCQVSLKNLTLLPLRGSRTVSAMVKSSIETYV